MNPPRASWLRPRWLLNRLKRRCVQKFLEGLPDAVDVIMRGIRAGLPLFDSIKIVAADASEPMKSEFLAIVDSQTIGIPLGEACTIALVQPITDDPDMRDALEAAISACI